MNPILKAISNVLILVGSALIFLVITQMVDSVVLADLGMLWWGMLFAVVGGFLKGWIKLT